VYTCHSCDSGQMESNLETQASLNRCGALLDSNYGEVRVLVFCTLSHNLTFSGETQVLEALVD
jgi:hypothetical protein